MRTISQGRQTQRKNRYKNISELLTIKETAATLIRSLMVPVWQSLSCSPYLRGKKGEGQIGSNDLWAAT